MSVRLVATALLTFALIGAPADALKVKKRDESWGRPGVTLAQYHADAQDCADATYRAPIKLNPIPPIGTGYAGVALPSGVWVNMLPSQVHIYTTTLVEGVRHATWMDVSEQLQRVLDQCLVDKGYSRFRLTAHQMAQLNRLKKMSPERQHYLYQLGSDANVVTAQKI